MKLYGCTYEAELNSALRDGTWPHACGAELHEHVVSCRDCSDLFLITQSFRQARAESIVFAPLPPPGLLWWKAQLRRRNAALERMNESMVVTGKIALACTLVAAIALGILKAHDVSGWLQWFSGVASSDALSVDPLISASPVIASMMPVIAGLAGIALFGGVAVYLLAYKE
jgi:hypothetical protein